MRIGIKFKLLFILLFIIGLDLVGALDVDRLIINQGTTSNTITPSQEGVTIGQNFTTLANQSNITIISVYKGLSSGIWCANFEQEVLTLYTNTSRTQALANQTNTACPPENTWINFDFGSVINVSSNTEYYFELNITCTVYPCQPTRFNEADVYTGGMLMTKLGEDTTLFPSYDMGFRIYHSVLNNIPTTPQISFPSNNSRHYNNSINYTWNQSTDADSDSLTYDFWLSSQSDFGNSVNRTNFTNNWTGSIATTDGVTYYGKVRSYDSYEYSSWSTVVQFIENTKPTIPSLIQHSDYHSISATTVNFTESTDTESDPLIYDIKVYNVTTGLLVINQAGTSNNYSQSFVSISWTTYNYTARAYDSYEYSEWATVLNFSFYNTVPSVQNVTISPSSPSVTANLTASLNATDGDSDSLSNHYIWYKNNVLQTAWNDTILIIYSGNYTSGDIIYVKGYVNDSYNDSSEIQSNTVSIGSENSAPSLSGIFLNPSSKKYNKSIWINSSGSITDSESSQVRMLTYYYNGSNKIYLGNSSWFIPPNSSNVSIIVPWSDGLTHTIYAQAEDSGNITGQSNLTSSEVTATFTSDVTAPTLVNSSLSAETVTIGYSINITAQFTVENGSVSSALVRVERPDATTANWSMTCDSGENVTCFKLYTATSDVGTYYVRYFYPTDDSENTGVISSSLSFTALTLPGGSSTGVSGGGGGAVIIIKDTNVTPVTNVTEAVEEVLKKVIEIKPYLPFALKEEIARCYAKGLFLGAECSSIFIYTEPMNWWILFGAFVSSLLLLIILAVTEDIPRKYILDTLTYGFITVLFILLSSRIGFNPYFLNYLTQSSLPFVMFLSVAFWGAIITLIGDALSKKRNPVYVILKGAVGI